MWYFNLKIQIKKQTNKKKTTSTKNIGFAIFYIGGVVWRKPHDSDRIGLCFFTEKNKKNKKLDPELSLVSQKSPNDLHRLWGQLKSKIMLKWSKFFQGNCMLSWVETLPFQISHSWEEHVPPENLTGRVFSFSSGSWFVVACTEHVFSVHKFL